MKRSRDQVFWDSLEILDNQHWIASSFKGRGDFEFSGNFRFSGSWNGTMTSRDEDSHLFVRSGATVMGKLKANRVSVEGLLLDVDVEANVFHALAGAKIVGRVQAKKIIVDEGAVIEGRVVSTEPRKREVTQARG